MENEILDYEPPRNEKPKLRILVGMTCSLLLLMLGMSMKLMEMEYSEWPVIVGNAMFINWFFIVRVSYRNDVNSWLGRIATLGLILMGVSFYIAPMTANISLLIKCITLSFIPIYFLGKPEGRNVNK